MKNDYAVPDSQPSRTSVISSTVVRLKAKRIRYLTPDEVPACGPRPAARRPAKVAQMLALAHHIQRVVDGGRSLDRTVAASRLGLTKARLTQLLDLTLLAPHVQEAILRLEAVDGVEPMSERRLRIVARVRDWRGQREMWRREFAEWNLGNDWVNGCSCQEPRPRAQVRRCESMSVASRRIAQLLPSGSRVRMAYDFHYGTAPRSLMTSMTLWG